MSQFSMNQIHELGLETSNEKNRLTPSKSVCSSNSFQVTPASCSYIIMKYTDGMFAFQMVFIFLIERMRQDYKVTALKKAQ